ncbi:MAG TPA: hypothetical protein VM008_20235 [Phycisphaerae bacterium]|nr:hypothetical protein [Phycisphaerae bacterium]
MMEEDDRFELALSRALRARPEHVPLANIAAVAMAQARVLEERAARLARISFWTRVSSVAAVLLIVATVAVAYWKWPSSTSSTTSTEVAESTDASSSSTSSSSIDMTTVGGGAFLLVVLAVVGLTVLTPEGPNWRLTPA